VVAYAEGYASLAQEMLRRVPRETIVEFACRELLGALMEAAPASIEDFIREELEAGGCESSRRGPLSVMAQAAVDIGQLELARAAIDRLERATGDCTDEHVQEVARLNRELDCLRRRRLRLYGARHHPTIAVWDGSPCGGRGTSVDLASLAVCAYLLQYCQIMPARMHYSELPQGDSGSRISVLGSLGHPPVDLDVLDWVSSPPDSWWERTWVLVAGLRLNTRTAALLVRKLRAERCILLATEVTDPGSLSPDMVEWLRQCEPIGCCDWSSVLLLRQARIAAFYAGSLVGILGRFVEATSQENTGKAEEERAKIRALVRTLQQRVLECFGIPYFGGDRIESLDLYLACLANGQAVPLRVPTLRRLRLEGVAGLSKIDLDALSDRHEARLRAVLSSISARDGSAIEAWRDACASDVAASDLYCKEYQGIERHDAPGGAIDLEICRTRAKAEKRVPRSAGVPVAFAIDNRMREQLSVVLESIVSNTSAQIHACVLCRGLGSDSREELERNFRGRVRFSFLDCDFVDYGAGVRVLSHTTVSTLDRLLLPELLPDIDRIIYLDVDLVVLGDLAELWAVDLQGRRLAAKSSSSPSARYVCQMVDRALSHLPFEQASDARRYLYDNFSMLSRAFNAGVLIMNLKRMREENFTRRFLPMVQHFGMNDQDVLNLYAGEERVELDPKWNAIPRQDITDGAAIIHFAGPVKPWSDLYISRACDFKAYEAKYKARTGRSFG